MAMDFWASLDHKIAYKFPHPDELPQKVIDELKESSNIVKELDKKMANLVGIVNEIDVEEE